MYARRLSTFYGRNYALANGRTCTQLCYADAQAMELNALSFSLKARESKLLAVRIIDEKNYHLCGQMITVKSMSTLEWGSQFIEIRIVLSALREFDRNEVQLPPWLVKCTAAGVDSIWPTDYTYHKRWGVYLFNLFVCLFSSVTITTGVLVEEQSYTEKCSAVICTATRSGATKSPQSCNHTVQQCRAERPWAAPQQWDVIKTIPAASPLMKPWDMPAY